MMDRSFAVGLVLVFSLATAAPAGVIFFDDFNAENGTTPTENYAGFANWSVTGGSVDLIGNGFADVYPDNGLYVDLDGTTSAAGTLESTAIINLVPGQYLFEFDLGDTNFLDGSPGTDNDLALSLLSDTDDLLANGDYASSDTSPDAMITQSLVFDVAVATSLTIRFAHAAPPQGPGDNYGLAIDNVRVSTIAAPAVLPLLALAAGCPRRRRA